jgi:cob(I)alamin adenosyltransferase
MPIYTKTGDRGTTALYGGKRVSKSDPQVEAYGTVDELSSFIGLTGSKLTDKADKEFLIDIQKDLYLLMANLSGAKTDLKPLEEKITGFERKIDELDKTLSKLTKFIIPCGSENASWFQVLRVLTRRAERKVIGLKLEEFAIPVKYLNRLSDLFFTMARSYNRDQEIVL